MKLLIVSFFLCLACSSHAERWDVFPDDPLIVSSKVRFEKLIKALGDRSEVELLIGAPSDAQNKEGWLSYRLLSPHLHRHFPGAVSSVLIKYDENRKVVEMATSVVLGEMKSSPKMR